MAKILGKNQRVYITTSGSSTAIVGETSSNLNLSADMIEVSDKSSAWKQYIAGMKGGTLDVTVYADSSDAAQMALLRSLIDGDANVSCVVGVSADEGYAFNALVSSIGESNDMGGAVTRSITLQITGEVREVEL